MEIELHDGMTFVHAKTGKTIVLLRKKPFGQLDMGQMMDGPIPQGLSGITRQWNATMRSVRALISDGTYVLEDTENKD